MNTFLRTNSNSYKFNRIKTVIPIISNALLKIKLQTFIFIKKPSSNKNSRACKNKMLKQQKREIEIKLF